MWPSVAFSLRYPGFDLLGEEQADFLALLSVAAFVGSGAAGTDWFIARPQTSCAGCFGGAVLSVPGRIFPKTGSTWG
jgi:hypothetical protein